MKCPKCELLNGNEAARCFHCNECGHEWVETPCPSCAEKDLLISRYAEELTRLMDVVGEYDCEVIDELLNGKGK